MRCRSSGSSGRIGVNTGEVVTGTSERLATGDAVNVAARFEQAAAPGEVLIGAATHALVHDAVVAEPVEPLTLKGKSEPVPAYRLLSVLDAPERSHAARFVGREPELAQIVRGVGARAGGGALRAGDGGGRRRRGQVAAGGGGARRGRGSRRPGPLPALRGGDHLLAGGGGGEAARGAAVGSGRGGGDALAPGRVGCRDERGRDRLGVPEAARGAGAAGGRLRRHPVGRGDVPRSGRVDGAALGRRAASAPVHGPAGAGGAASRLAGGRCGWSRCRRSRRTR